MSEWKPIETAPQDGTPILVCGLHLLPAVVRWIDPTEGDRRQGVPTRPLFGWYMSDGKNDPVHYRGWMNVTHWQPLPPPPPETTER